MGSTIRENWRFWILNCHGDGTAPGVRDQPLMVQPSPSVSRSRLFSDFHMRTRVDSRMRYECRRLQMEQLYLNFGMGIPAEVGLKQNGHTSCLDVCPFKASEKFCGVLAPTGKSCIQWTYNPRLHEERILFNAPTMSPNRGHDSSDSDSDSLRPTVISALMRCATERSAQREEKEKVSTLFMLLRPR